MPVGLRQGADDEVTHLNEIDEIYVVAQCFAECSFEPTAVHVDADPHTQAPCQERRVGDGEDKPELGSRRVVVLDGDPHADFACHLENGRHALLELVGGFLPQQPARWTGAQIDERRAESRSHPRGLDEKVFFVVLPLGSLVDRRVDAVNEVRHVEAGGVDVVQRPLPSVRRHLARCHTGARDADRAPQREVFGEGVRDAAERVHGQSRVDAHVPANLATTGAKVSAAAPVQQM